jgi:hypothetical protein
MGATVFSELSVFICVNLWLPLLLKIQPPDLGSFASQPEELAGVGEGKGDGVGRTKDRWEVRHGRPTRLGGRIRGGLERVVSSVRRPGENNLMTRQGNREVGWDGR